MKKFILFFFATTLAVVSFASTITLVKSGSSWTDNTVWNPRRQPASGDTILIPAGYSVTLDRTISLNGVVLQVLGSIRLDNGKLTLNNTSIVSIGSTGSIRGSNSTDQVTIAGVIKYKGTQPAQTGPAVASVNTGTAPIAGFSATGTLPVVYQSFTVTYSNNAVLVTWTTAQELNNNHFEVEKSTDGNNWTAIASVSAVGNSTISSNYSFTDKSLHAAIAYYRIRQVDNDGANTYTEIKAVKTNSTASTKIYATQQNIQIDFNKEMTSNYSVRIINLNGQVMLKKDYNTTASAIAVSHNGMPRGLYIVQVSDGKDWIASSKIML
jgi:hypothetical protein